VFSESASAAKMKMKSGLYTESFFTSELIHLKADISSFDRHKEYGFQKSIN